MAILPGGTAVLGPFIPPRPTWARADVHEHFWRVVGRAVERTALPPSVWAADPDPDDMAQATTEADGSSPDEEVLGG